MGNERDQWRKLDAEATPGPWERQGFLKGFWNPRPAELLVDAAGSAVFRRRKEMDAEFIAAARTGWPAAEAEVEQLRALLREIHSAAKKGSLPFAIAVARKIDQSGLLGGSDG